MYDYKKGKDRDFPSLYQYHFLIKHPTGFSMWLWAIEIDWHRLADNGVLSGMFAALIWCRGRDWCLSKGRWQENAASIWGKKEERDVGSVCAPNYGVCVERGEGKEFVSYDLHYWPSHSYKVNAASRAGRLGSFSYVSIWWEILDSRSCWLSARPQSPLR